MTTLFSVKNGKFHKPAVPVTREGAWLPTLTACHLTVEPVNYFATIEDADRHTGGRLSKFLCQHCAKAEG
jgi:hypothetical protein